jgi:tRNA(Ile)-lysidine synthase
LKEKRPSYDQVALVTADEVRFDLPGLSGVHPALQRILLRRGYAALTGGALRLRESHLTAMADMAADKTPGTVLELPSGIRLHRGYTSLVLSKDTVLPCPLPLLEDEYPLTLPLKGESESTFEGTGWRITLNAGDSIAPAVAPASDAPNPAVAPVWSARLDRAALDGPLLVRTRRPGDRFQPLGMQREKKLQDFFTDSKVPRSWRDRVPLLVSGRGIAWVVGYRVAHWAAATGGALPDADVILATFQTNMRNSGPNGLNPAS